MLTGKSVTASLHRAVPGFLQRAYGVLFRPAPQISDTVVKKTARLDSIDFSEIGQNHFHHCLHAVK